MAATRARTGEWSREAEFPVKMSTETSCPWQGAGASLSPLCLDPGFFCSRLRGLALLHQVLGLLVWALVANRTTCTSLWLGRVRCSLPLAGNNRLLHPLPVSAAREAARGALTAGVSDI